MFLLSFPESRIFIFLGTSANGQDPEVTLFENFVSEEEAWQGPGTADGVGSLHIVMLR